jgi:uncharacterized protein
LSTPARARIRLLATLAVVVALTTAATAAPKFPALAGRVVDEAGLLTADDRQRMTAELAALEEKSTDQLVVVTLRSLQGYEIEEYGYQLGRAWGIGQKGAKNNGVLLIVAPNERKVRIEVGRGLEPQLTDALTKLIIENRILPAFRRGDFAGGIKLGAEDIRGVLLGDAEAVKERAKGARRPTGGESRIDPIAIAFLILWIAMFIYMFHQSRRQANQMPTNARARQRRDVNDGWIIIPGPGHSGGWGGGWSGGGGGGDGGFSGGGGDFGGGGSSGSW